MVAEEASVARARSDGADGDSPSGTPSRTRSRAVAWASVASALIASAVFAAAVLMPQETDASPVAAPLEFAGSKTIEQIMADAAADLEAGAGPDEPVRTVQVAAWAASADDATLEPEISELTWNQDLSGELLRFASVPTETGDGFRSGGVVEEQTIAVGGLDSPFVDLPGDSLAGVTELLHAYGMPHDPTTGDVVHAITAALDQWTLTNVQHAAMLGLVVEAGGVTAVGDAVDRFGRAVAGVQVPSADADSHDVLLISTESGRIVGVETTVGIAEVRTLAGYRLWGVDVGVRR
ncbi:hypothetical protein [Microbacterium sp.]|uniref:hypothetical protein n=1 Tax=Microbacterium sp. TaxID=51671 RepID=UPI002FDFA485